MFLRRPLRPRFRLFPSLTRFKSRKTRQDITPFRPLFPCIFRDRNHQTPLHTPLLIRVDRRPVWY